MLDGQVHLVRLMTDLLDRVARHSPAPADVDLLFTLTKSLYGHLADELPQQRGHCREVMIIAHHVAVAMALPHATASGFRLMPGNVKDIHHWVLINGRVLHSPSRGVVEWAEPSGFEVTQHHHPAMSVGEGILVLLTLGLTVLFVVALWRRW